MVAFLLTGLLVIVLIALYTGKQQRNANSIMDQNKDVLPLLKRKAAQLAPVRVQQSSVNNRFPKGN